MIELTFDSWEDFDKAIPKVVALAEALSEALPKDKEIEALPKGSLDN
jgi:hypothetical protein